MLTFEQSIFHYFPWLVLSLFILWCNFKNTNKPIVSKIWLNSSRVIGFLFLAISAALYIARYFPEWEYYKFRHLQSEYLFTTMLLGYLGNSLKGKKLITIEPVKNV